jgi:hypothetical protein
MPPISLSAELFAGHSLALFLLLGGVTLLMGVYGYLHARKFWEGLPPLLDAFASMAGFLMIIGAFMAGGRLGAQIGHPHAGRVLAVAIALILYRAMRTWIGKEQVKYRKILIKGQSPNSVDGSDVAP